MDIVNQCLLVETGEKWAIIRESTLKIRKKLGISVLHKTLALPINKLHFVALLVIFSLVFNAFSLDYFFF